MQYIFPMQWPKESLYCSTHVHAIANYRYHHHLKEYELNILFKGQQEYCRDKETFLLKEDDVIITDPALGHASMCREIGAASMVLRFSESSLRSYHGKDSRISFSRCNSVIADKNSDAYRKIRYYSALIYKSASQGGPYSTQLAKSAFEMLLSVLCTECEPQVLPIKQETEDQIPELIQSLLDYMETHFKEKITLEDLANFSNYNRSYISTLFKNTVGVNFYEYLTRIRFRSAVTELATTDKTMTDIAIENGFPDLKSFNARFKDTLHRSPSEYRSEILPGQALNLDEMRYIAWDNPVVLRKLDEYLKW